MNEELIRRWNQKVTPHDEVYYLGDFTFTSSLSKAQDILHRLNGTKFLIQGNHDAKHLHECGFVWKQPHHQLTLIDSLGRTDSSLEVYLCHYPYVEPSLLHMNIDNVIYFDDEHGEYIRSLFSTPIDDLINACKTYQDPRTFLLKHYGTKLKPSEKENNQTKTLQSFLQKVLNRLTWRQPRPEGTLHNKWLLHGHVHSLWKVKPLDKMINVAVEVWDLEPVSEQDLVNIILDNRC